MENLNIDYHLWKVARTNTGGEKDTWQRDDAFIDFEVAWCQRDWWLEKPIRNNFFALDMRACS